MTLLFDSGLDSPASACRKNCPATGFGEAAPKRVPSSAREGGVRGHSCSPLISTRSPSLLHRASSSRRSSARRVSPTRRRISRADAGITGSSRIAATRTASATSKSTCVRRSRLAGSLARAQGSVLAMNSLAASISPKTAATPSSSANASIARRYTSRACAASPGNRPGALADTRRPSRYFSAIATMRLTRLPRLFARSTL